MINDSVHIADEAFCISKLFHCRFSFHSSLFTFHLPYCIMSLFRIQFHNLWKRKPHSSKKMCILLLEKKTRQSLDCLVFVGESIFRFCMRCSAPATVWGGKYFPGNMFSRKYFGNSSGSTSETNPLWSIRVDDTGFCMGGWGGVAATLALVDFPDRALLEVISAGWVAMLTSCETNHIPFWIL